MTDDKISTKVFEVEAIREKVVNGELQIGGVAVTLLDKEGKIVGCIQMPSKPGGSSYVKGLKKLLGVSDKSASEADGTIAVPTKPETVH